MVMIRRLKYKSKLYGKGTDYFHVLFLLMAQEVQLILLGFSSSVKPTSFIFPQLKKEKCYVPIVS